MHDAASSAFETCRAPMSEQHEVCMVANVDAGASRRRRAATPRMGPPSRSSQQQQQLHPSFDQLPDDALQLIFSRVSTPSTPACCLLSLVSPSWGAAAETYMAEVYLTLGQAPATRCQHADRWQLPGMRRTRASSTARAAAAPSSTVAAAAAATGHGRGVPDKDQIVAAAAEDSNRLRSFAAWLQNHSSGLQLLHITAPFDSVYIYNEWLPMQQQQQVARTFHSRLVEVTRSLAAAGARAAGGPVPLTSLRLPVLSSPALAPIARALAACPELRELCLDESPLSTRPLAAVALHGALRQLTHLTLLQLDCCAGYLLPAASSDSPVDLGPLLSSCPGSLHTLVLQRGASIYSFEPSQLIHLTRLQRLQLPKYVQVQQSGSSSQQQQQQHDHHPKQQQQQSYGVLPQLTTLQWPDALSSQGSAALLAHLPELQQLHAVAPTWRAPREAPEGLAQLTAMTRLTSLVCRAPTDLHIVEQLGALTQLRQLVMYDSVIMYTVHGMRAGLPMYHAALAALTQLQHLAMPHLLVGKADDLGTLLAPLQQLQSFTVVMDMVYNGYTELVGRALNEVVEVLKPRAQLLSRLQGVFLAVRPVPGGQLAPLNELAVAALPGVPVSVCRLQDTVLCQELGWTAP